MEKIKNDAFKLIELSLGGKMTNQNGQSGIDCGNLWQKFEKGNFSERIPDRLNNEIYAVYFNYEGDYTQLFSYFIGCKVKNDTIITQGMTHMSIPSGNFTKVVAKGKMPDCVANSWNDISNSNTERSYNYDYEVYGERSRDWNDAEVDIFVLVC